MDRLPAHFRQEPSRWKDISSFMSKRPNNDANTHYKAFGGFLHLIHDTSEAGYYEKTIALELLNTITLPDFQVRSRLMRQEAAVRAAEHAMPNPVYFITWKAVLDFISEGLFKFETLELNNSEFKAVGVDIEENKKQSRKNIRINKAIMDYLQRHAKFDLQNGDYMVFLDVSGYTSTIVYLRRYEDIYVPGLLSRVAIKLPFIRLLPVAGWKNSVVDYSLCETGQLSKVDAESDAQLTIEYMLHEARELEQSYRLAKSLSMF
ncbi:hypothetical protein BC939DRAFT_472742 [Gamsiella multidivaricata]|uniref:uncharacterized protein n=1 Tax=Gamsiella multidivaricata TaxID=101098 RepID=UPI0022207E13|nr:uncharacterized protein BC939DRAFT_472742 [Gamsiella multidivaricata]KAI7831621.1 hypothetical protein BC939DRAFT_472742 [Gamsiella multidivaricata]